MPDFAVPQMNRTNDQKSPDATSGDALRGLFFGALLSLPFWALAGWLVHLLIR